jgi:hypothetical protein
LGKLHAYAEIQGMLTDGLSSVLGEQVGGPLSDFFMNSRARKIGRLPPPEYRIWSSYVGFVCAIIGFIVFGVQLQNTPNLDWNVTPLVGVAFAAFGNQVITTALVTCKYKGMLAFRARALIAGRFNRFAP